MLLYIAATDFMNLNIHSVGALFFFDQFLFDSFFFLDSVL